MQWSYHLFSWLCYSLEIVLFLSTSLWILFCLHQTIFFSNPVCLLFSWASTSTVNILSIYSVVLSEASSMIYKDSSYSDNTSILCSWYWFVLLFVDYATCVLFLPMVKPSIIQVAWPLCTLLLQGEPGDTLWNVITLDLA